MSQIADQPDARSAERVVDALIARIGKRLVVGTPLGLGKGNLVLNELFRRALKDGSIELSICTALTLEPPAVGEGLKARFMGPLVERLFGDTPQLDYARARRARTLPSNVRVHEFFFAPGRFLDDAGAQRDYISSNYTHVARDMLARGVNVIVQMVAPGTGRDAGRYSLSCNPDVSLDLVPRMRTRGAPCAVVAEVNDRLPFMYGDAVVDSDYFDLVCVPPGGGYALFGVPKEPVSAVDHAIGLYASALVPDGGTLQVGIGSMGDAVINALLLRHTDNVAWRRALSARLRDGEARLVTDIGGQGTFETGLYGATEMLVDGFLDLYDKGILKRRVYDDISLQRLLDDGRIGERPNAATLRALVSAGAVAQRPDAHDMAYLHYWGILSKLVTLGDGHLQRPGRAPCDADLLAAQTHEWLADGGFGARLRHGVVAHGGFFLGPRAFYERLAALPEADRRRFAMTSVGRINQLYGGEELDHLQRMGARFVNSCLQVTLNGAVVSDTLADGRVLSGVGGQYNFVAMAHAVRGGRSIIMARATRTARGVTTTNIVYNYAQTTIPRHLRDIIVTEYGIADLRGKTDAECMAALLEITDARFQDELLEHAAEHGKLPADHRISEHARSNSPDVIEAWLGDPSRAGLFPAFPLGTDFTPEELELGAALRRLEAATSKPGSRARTLVGAVARARPVPPALLERMDLAAPGGVREWLFRCLLGWALR